MGYKMFQLYNKKIDTVALVIVSLGLINAIAYFLLTK